MVTIISEVVRVNRFEAEKLKQQYQRYKQHSQSPEDFPGTFHEVYRYESANDGNLQNCYNLDLWQHSQLIPATNREELIESRTYCDKRLKQFWSSLKAYLSSSHKFNI